MKPSYLAFMGILACLAGCMKSGCSKNPLLPPDPIQAGSINGAISVTALSGTAASANQAVFVAAPDGSKQIKITGPDGTAIFQAHQTGVYNVSAANQSTCTLYTTQASLSASQPNQNVTLQTSGIQFPVTSLDSKPQQYQFLADTFVYQIAYLNPTITQYPVTLSLDANGLPSGWSASISDHQLKPGDTTDLTITSARGTNAPSATLILKATTESQCLETRSLSLTKNWTGTVQRAYWYVYTGLSLCHGGGSNYYNCPFRFGYVLSGTNLSSPYGQATAAVVLDSISVTALSNCYAIEVSTPQWTATEAFTDAGEIAMTTDSAAETVIIQGHYVLGDQTTYFTDLMPYNNTTRYKWYYFN